MENKWLRNKGYIHLTPQIDIIKRRKEIISKICNPRFVSKYAFFPLLNVNIKERRFKTVPGSQRKAHSYKKNGQIKKTAKIRPLHYAAHMDALIFAYYSEILYNKYDALLKSDVNLDNSVIAYRSIKDSGGEKSKGTIHFAKEVFDEINLRASNECAVLKLDIKSFFNQMDHIRLKEAWSSLLGLTKLPNDHYNVFKAATRFSYINKDDLRLKHSKNNKRREGFDEKELAKIRRVHGKKCFFESTKHFRDKVKTGELKIYRFPFKKDGKPVGIPQGLPISATLANLYLLEFDKSVIENIVNSLGAFYRRYSDDIIVICKVDDMKFVEDFLVTEIKKSLVELSIEKKEEFIFRNIIDSNSERVKCFKIVDSREIIGVPFTYLGFEFYGYKTLIKSANLAKFYRRMILAVKRKSNRAFKSAAKEPGTVPVIYHRQLYKLYTYISLSSNRPKRRQTWLQRNEIGEYSINFKEVESKYKSNYLSYITRTSEIMNAPEIKKQLRKHKKILHQALQRRFYNKKSDL